MTSQERKSSKYKEAITPEELALYELSWFRGTIFLIDNMDSFHKILPRLRSIKILGFDTETKPTFRKGKKNAVSLMQLANGEYAFLFRIKHIGIPDELAAILSDPNIIKTGVAIHDDIKALRNVKKFNPSGFIDLQSYVKDFGITSAGLKKLAGIILGFRISKRQQVSDWEAAELSEPQIVYAATDAWVCHQIYEKLSAEQEDETGKQPAGGKS